MEKTKNIVDYRSFHSAVVKPFTVKELKERENKSGEISEKVVIDIDDLINCNILWLANFVSKKITGNDLALKTISYKVAGRTTNNQVILKATGKIDYLCL